MKKPLLTKRSGNGLSTANGTQTRKRAALGDVSNVAKVEGQDAKDGKKAVVGKSGLVSKAAQPTRVQKAVRANSTRSILGVKDKNTAAVNHPKRPASGLSLTGNAAKKRNTSSSASRHAEDDLQTENVAPHFQRATVTVEIEQTEEIVESVEGKDVEIVEIKEKKVQELEQEVAIDNALAQKLDAEDLEDPLMVAEYVYEIFDYLRDLEVQTMANPQYMNRQADLRWKMRGVLVDWLLEVHTRFPPPTGNFVPHRQHCRPISLVQGRSA